MLCKWLNYDLVFSSMLADKRNLYWKKFKMISQKLRGCFRAIGTVVFLFTTMFSNVTPSTAQQAFFWSSQKRIPNYYDSTEEPPYLIADMNHTVHAFNAQPLDLDEKNSPNAIFYRQWTLESDWTLPNDIIVDINGLSIYLLGVAYDHSGLVHLIIQKNDGIYYTKNYLSDANYAPTWPTMTLIAENSSRFGPGYEIVSAIATNSDGNEILVVFSGTQVGNGLYFSKSLDGGDSWTRPYPIYLTSDEFTIVTDPKLFMGDSGKIHAVWSTFLESGAGGPGYYANFDFANDVWSEPIELDVPGIRTPSVIEYENYVMVSYYHNNVNGNWWRLSNDGGSTWTYPVQISPGHIGTTGQVSFVIDSSNILRAFFGNRINDANHGVWHSIWRNNSWTNPEAVVRGPEVRDVVGGNGFGPRSARAVVSNGNVILVTWGTDGFQGPNGAWYSYKRVDAPELPTISLPSSREIFPENDSTPIENVNPTEIVADAGDPTPIVDINSIPRNTLSNPQTQILIGVVPAFLLLVVLLIVRYLFYSKH